MPKASQSVQMIPIDRINILNPRVRSQKLFAEFRGNISKVGLKRPITVSPCHSGAAGKDYDLVCGQGRIEAFMACGQTHIPALVVDASEQDALVMSLVENMARRKHRAMELYQLIRLQPDVALDGFSRRVAVKKDGIEVELNLNPLLPESVEQSVISMILSERMVLQRRGSETRLVIPGADLSTQPVDSTLLTSVARAHVWAEEILSGKTAAMTDIAIREKVSDSYVKKVMPLAFLAPDIVTAIIEGRQPPHLTNQMMIRHMQIPLDWQEQRRVFGFPAQF